MKTHKKPLYILLSGCLLVGLSLFVGNTNLLSNVLNEQGKLMCFTQGEIDEELAEVRAEKSALEDERMQVRLQEEALKEKIGANSLSLESARVEAETAQKEVLSEEEMARREKEVTDLLVQMGEKEALEGLKKDMDSKMSIAASDEKKALDLLALVGPAKSAYDALLVQYNLKKELGVLANELKTLPLPTSAQRNARKTLEAQALAADPAKRPSDVQISDRKKLEELLIARDAAKRNIPTSNKAPGYQAAVNAYNVLKNKYSADLATYRNTYASSAFGVNLTFAQLTVKRDQHTKAQSTYTGSLASYNTTYPTNSALTLAQLNELVVAHNTAKSALTAKQATYNTQYPTTKNKTLEQLGVLLNGPNGVKAKYDTVNNTYLAAQKTYDTVSKVTSELARDLFEAAKGSYEASHPLDTRTAGEIRTAYDVIKKAYDELVASNDAKKAIYAGLETKRKEFEDIGIQLNEQMADIMELLISIGGKLSPLEEKIAAVEAKKCPETEQGLCGDGVDNNRDGTQDCADSYCLEFDPVCKPTQCPDGTTVRYGEACATSICGNGAIEGTEVCDDGNTSDENTNYGDTCSSDCLRVTGMRCGNGTVEPSIGETCDEGANNGLSMGSCSNTCQRVETYNYTWGPVCGNGTQETGEACDDGNTMSGDGCSASCQWDMMAAMESCGNGVCEGSETSGTCPGDCSYDNMGGNIEITINKCGDMVCQEENGETNMTCFNDCDDMIIALGLTKSGIITHEFTIEEIKSLTHEEFNSVINILTTYTEKLRRYIEKLETWGVEYDNCSTRACQNEILNRLREGQYLYSANFFTRSITYITQIITPNIFAQDSSSWIQEPQENVGENMIRKFLSDFSQLEEQANNRLRKIQEWREKGGCTDQRARNYNPTAKYDDGSCQYYIGGCMDSSAKNFNPNANYEDGSCQYYTYGCMDSSASNYNSNANYEDGSCVYDDDCNIEPPVDDGICPTLPTCGQDDPNAESNRDILGQLAEASRIVAEEMEKVRNKKNPRCWRGVKDAIRAAGLDDGNPLSSSSATNGVAEMRTMKTFREIEVCEANMEKINQPGVVRFYATGGVANHHVAIKQSSGDTSDFISKTGCPAKITAAFEPIGPTNK